MKPRFVVALGLLLCSTTWVQADPQQARKPQPAPATPQTQHAGESGKDGRPLRGVDRAPNTDQSLPDSVVIGRVDDKLLRGSDLRRAWLAANPQDLHGTDSLARLGILNSLVNKEVLAALARQVNKPLDFGDRTKLREARRQALSNVAFERLVADSVEPAPEELQRIYEQGKNQLLLQHIVTDEAATAEATRADILEKRLSWEQAVKERSTRRGDTGPNGTLGWATRTSFDFVPALEIFGLPDGALSSVFRSADGWEIVRIIGRRPVAQPDFQVAKRGLYMEARATRVARRSEFLRERIRERIGMIFDDANISWAAIRFRETSRPEPPKPGEMTIDLGARLPEFPPADTARVLARWRDGQLTLGSFLEAYGQLPVLSRGKIGGMQTLRAAIDNVVLEPHIIGYAVEQGLENDPMVAAAVAKKEEQIRVEHLFADSVEAHLRATPEERRKYFEEHQAQYSSWARVTFAALVRHSKAGADSLAARLKAGEPAADILRADSVAGFVSGSIKEMREDDPSPLHKLLFEELRPGGVEVTAPDQLGDYLILQKLTHEPSRQLRFEEVESIVGESVETLQGEELLKQLLARHRPGHDIELHPELLMRIVLVKLE